MTLMSQQPPYGEPPKPEQQPGQQPGYPPGQQPYTPYSQGAYPNPYGQMPQQPNHTTRNVLLIVGLVILLFCGGLVTLAVVAVNNVSDTIDDGFNEDYRGSQEDPLVIDEGDAFEIRDYNYAEGWSFVVGGDDFSDRVNDLKVTDNRDDTDYSGAAVVLTFYDGDEATGQVDCRSSVDLRKGKSTVLECSGDPVPATYETLEVYSEATYD